jgi:FKBP-type peptidyl-prolyl cis-trans isomerase 2
MFRFFITSRLASGRDLYFEMACSHMNQEKNVIDKNSSAEIEFQVKWESLEGRHTDVSLVMVDFGHDLLHENIYDALMGAQEGDRRTVQFDAKRFLPDYDAQNQHRLKRADFNQEKASPAFGRFYPKGILKGLPNVFPQNITPVRCVGVDSVSVTMDMNHPLAGYDIEITAVVNKIKQKTSNRGGSCRELAETIASGPGMQARYKGNPTDFSIPGAFDRQDETHDHRFYEKPRLVTHIDDQAIEIIAALYGERINPGSRVLDLMSSWRSHVPESAKPGRMVGLGMNASEMVENPQLDEFVVHDLNQNPRTPFDDNSFDVVICTVSVEYLTNPGEVFQDSARIIKPGGVLIHTFSNRWFPPKVIRIWTRLHEFERMGLVMDYFLKTESFNSLGTFSARGWNRPETDAYFPDMRYSDPVFAVFGRKKHVHDQGDTNVY